MLESAIDSQAGSQAVGKVFHLFVGMFLWHGSDTRERTQWNPVGFMGGPTF